MHWSLFFIILFAFILHPKYGRLLEYSFDIRSMEVNFLTQINGVAYLISRLFMVGSLNIDPDLPVVSALSGGLAIKAVLLLIPVVSGIVFF